MTTIKSLKELENELIKRGVELNYIDDIEGDFDFEDPYPSEEVLQETAKILKELGVKYKFTNYFHLGKGIKTNPDQFIDLTAKVPFSKLVDELYDRYAASVYDIPEGENVLEICPFGEGGDLDKRDITKVKKVLTKYNIPFEQHADNPFSFTVDMDRIELDYEPGYKLFLK